MKINEPVPEEAMQAQAITLPPLCFRWACMFGIMSRSLFLQTLAFPSLWSIKSVHKTWGSSPILLANEWFASSGVASVLLFMKSSANSRLWYLHSCPLEVVADVTNSCFMVFLYSCHQGRIKTALGPGAMTYCRAPHHNNNIYMYGIYMYCIYKALNRIFIPYQNYWCTEIS